jgi:hypothetical protein
MTRPVVTNDDPKRPNPMGPHVQVVVGWLDDNGCLLPDPDGIAYRRTFTDWKECDAAARACPRCGGSATNERAYPTGFGENPEPVIRYYCAPCDHEWWV